MSDFVNVGCLLLPIMVVSCLFLKGFGLDYVFLQAPSATVVVKGLSQKTTEEDLYQILVLIYLIGHYFICKCLLFT